MATALVQSAVGLTLANSPLDVLRSVSSSDLSSSTTSRVPVEKCRLCAVVQTPFPLSVMVPESGPGMAMHATCQWQ